ncbi:MAG: hypothetical protein WCI04_04860 [archaeon]
MAQKKKSKVKRVSAVKKVSVQNEVVREKPMGFFQRTKDIIRQESPQKTVRVKTFIVEKPIIIHEKPQHINISGDDGDEVTISEDRKKFKRKFRGVELEEAPEPVVDDADSDELGAEDDFANDSDISDDASGELGETGEDVADDELVGGEGGDDIESQVKRKHVRSRGMIINVWWKKAILWGFLAWILILLLELGMQSIGLVVVDLTRQWWILLAGILVISLFYCGVVESRVKF